MASLAAAHKGYFYQDVASAYFLARSLVEQIRSTTIDAKLHANDRFDDLLVAEEGGDRVRRQFKHSESLLTFERSFLTSDKYDLRLDRLIKSWQSDPVNVRATECRVCVRWRIPTSKDDQSMLKPSDTLSSFEGESRCFKLDVAVIWPKGRQPLFKCLKHIKRREFVSFAKRLVIELECPAASYDLDRPGPMEHLLLGVLADRVGFGRYPNENRGPLEAAAQLILLAYKTRGADLAHSTLTPDNVVAELGLVTDYGRIAQQFPFKADVFVSIPSLRRELLEKVNAGGITVLSGGPGAGKSWELTDLMKRLRAHKVIVAAHYCYLEPGDPLVQSRVTLNAFYGNLMADIIEAMPELQQHSPTRYAAGPAELQALLDAAGAMKPAPRLVVIVDGLDHIARVLCDARALAPADTQIARELLTLKLPKNVSILVGSQPGDHITQLAHSGTILNVSPWDEPEVEVFLRRVPLGKKLKTSRGRNEGRAELIAELTTRSQGNALYCTYLCRELKARLDETPGMAPLTLLRQLPANDGKLSTYYEFLLGSLDSGGRLVGEVMGLIDFGVTSEEIQEIFPLFQGRIGGILKQLAPILEETRGQGGIRIYHESFRRYLVEKSATDPGSLGSTLENVIAWLDGKGFLSDSRAFRFLLPNLERAGRGSEILARIDRDFVVCAVAEGHPNAVIDANLSLYGRVAAEAGDFPTLIRAAELARALGTCNDNLSDAYEYGTTYAAIFGVDRLAERLSFDGVPTFKVPEGLKLCSFCADAGVTPPWHAYLRKPLSTDNDRQNMRAEMAHFHGRVRTGEGKQLRSLLVEFLSEAGDNADTRYIASLARRWADEAGHEDLPRLKKESGCNATIAEIFDLEFARRTSNANQRKEAATRVARRTESPERAIEALQLGADRKFLTHWTDNLENYEIGIGGSHIGEGNSLHHWVLGIRIAAYVKPKLLTVEEIRTRGEGWYRNWLAFVIALARIERQAVSSPADAANDVVETFRVLASDVHPFKGAPRACDLLRGHGVIHDSIEIALGLLQTPAQWRRVIALLKKICSGTTTSLQRSQSGPLTPSALVELAAPFAKQKHLQALIRREIEPLIQDQHHGGLYSSIASDEMALASLLITMGDRSAALKHWKDACLHLCAYGMRKDSTIFEVLDNVRALARAGKSHVLERLSKLLPMVNAVILHTDGKGTHHAMGEWFEQLVATDELSAAWLLGRSMADDGGSYDYRIEEGLVHWLKHVGLIDGRLWLRLAQLVEGPTSPAEIKQRLDLIELLRTQDASAAELEFHLLAASVHGDPFRFPKEGFALIENYAKRYCLPLSAGGHDISPPRREDYMPDLLKDPPKSKSRWKRPKAPLALLRRLQEVLHRREVSTDQILAYCEASLVEWADAYRVEVEEILTVIARANRFGDRSSLLSDLGTAFEAAGKAELTAHALTLAFAGNRGGGGWLSFGDQEHEDLLVRAFKASRRNALAILAQEMAHRLGHWGVTRHVIGFFGRHDDIALATSMWDEAREAMLVRLPGHKNAQGPFLPFEPTQAPSWTDNDAAMFLILARISHPERRRKTAALCGAAWLIQSKSTKCITAFLEMLKASLSFTHQLWLLQLLVQFEPAPYAISKTLASVLNELVGSSRCGTEQLALLLLNRAKIPVTSSTVRNNPVATVIVSPDEQRKILSLDSHDVVSKVAKLWPDFPTVVASRFETIVRSDESHKARMADRWEARWSIGQKSYPVANFHGWEDELFADSLNEVLMGLEAHLWSKGEWDANIWPEVLSWILSDARIPSRHYWSRRVRPSWLLPSLLSEGVNPVQSVPDGELVGWQRIGYCETYLDCESSINEIKLKTHVTAGVILDEKPQAIPRSFLPVLIGDDRVWWHRFRTTFPLDAFHGPIAGYSLFSAPFELQEWLGLHPSLAAALELTPRSEIGPLDLLDKDGNLAVAYRWWRCRPLGEHNFSEETPKLYGGALLMRPDIFDQIVDATKLHAFEAISLHDETTEDLIGGRHGR